MVFQWVLLKFPLWPPFSFWEAGTVLGTEPKALHMLGKQYLTELHLGLNAFLSQFNLRIGLPDFPSSQCSRRASFLSSLEDPVGSHGFCYIASVMLQPDQK